jgi:hypothetical protein
MKMDTVDSVDSVGGVASGFERPVHLGFNAGQIANLAASVAARVGYQPGDDLSEVVRKLGGSISVIDFWGGTGSDSGSIEIKDDQFEIRLASTTGPLRNRFTIAHEIGHFILHYLYRNQFMGGNASWMVAERFGTNQAEREANAFAAAFLMPEAAYREQYATHQGGHVAISRKFGVSVAASEVRAKALGLESPDAT